MDCPNCKYKLPAEANFCTNCGVDIPAGFSSSRESVPKKLCSHCGQSFLEEDMCLRNRKSYCLSCFQQIVERADLQEKNRRKTEDHFLKDSGLEDRRGGSHRRFQVSRCIVRVSRRGVGALLLGQRKPRAGSVIDLSVSGIQFVSAMPLESEDTVILEIVVPAFNNPVEVEGQVRWVVVQGKEEFRVGVQFVNPGETVIRQLTALREYRSLREAGDV